MSDENYYYGKNILEFSMGEKIEKKIFRIYNIMKKKQLKRILKVIFLNTIK